jgi:hypothetical protein
MFRFRLEAQCIGDLAAPVLEKLRYGACVTVPSKLTATNLVMETNIQSGS